MKILLLSLTITFLTINSMAQPASRLVAETDYVPSSNAFVPQDSIVYRYTGNHGGDLNHPLKFTTMLYEVYLHPGYDSLYTGEYQTFDANDNIDSTIQVEWNNYYWLKTNDDLYAYDADNQDTSFITQVYDSISPQNVWLNNEKTVYGYDSNDNDTLVADYGYDSITWFFGGKASYTYDSHNNTTSEILIAPPDEGSGFDTTTWLFIYGYNTKGEDTIETILQKDSATAPVDTLSQLFYTYYANSTNDSVESFDTWIITGKRQHEGRIFYTYDNNNNNTSYIYQLWSDTSWENNYEYLYTYNGFNQLTSKKLLYWNDSGYWQINTQISSEEFYYYQDYTTGINQLSLSGDQLSVYPNPSSNYVHVAVTLQQVGKLQLSLINILGQTVWSVNEGTTSQFNRNIYVSDLPGGVYLLEMETGNGVETQKIIVAK